MKIISFASLIFVIQGYQINLLDILGQKINSLTEMTIWFPKHAIFCEKV